MTTHDVVTSVLPPDHDRAVLVGRVWDSATGGPRPALVRGQEVHDLFPLAATVSDLLERADLREVLAGVTGPPRWRLDELVGASLERRTDRSHLLAPVDLQVVKACGVTFVDSMIERVIEERAAGDPDRAAHIRRTVAGVLHEELAGVQPGTAAAQRVKDVFVAEGLWSQYLEVGLGPHPEVFTKAPVLSSVGYGAHVGIPHFSSWNNPEPELVLVVDSTGRARGATLGNDVNLRDVEGRSALLLGMAKDNTASSALGPFVRLFDGAFSLDTLRAEQVTMRVEGPSDGFVMDGVNNVSRLSRPFEDLIAATYGPHHQYPDGFVLYTGTLFAATKDRDVPGAGFTHKPGDIVTISSRHLGTLVNEVAPTDEIPRWEFGIRALYGYLEAVAG
ncbi:MAG TPA: fumarylacetoacetate hydrolase family protein [Actinomycetaceae bacterium]|nr:fumarylacetoacetate hydrolase family protein [Actinomycetaceae bacterium]